MSILVLEHLQNTNSSSPDLTIDSNGRIGIGTETPSELLHVSGTGVGPLKLHSTNANGAYIRLSNVDTDADPDHVWIGAQGNDTKFYQSNSLLSMIIKSDGKVGIGTTSPGHKLDVDGGSIRVQDVGQYIYFGTNASVKIGTVSSNSADLYLGSADDLNMESNFIRFWRDGYYGSTEYGRLSFSDDSWLCTGSSSHYLGIGTPSPSERLEVSGNILASGNITASSDISLKDNIEVIPNALDKVLQIRGVTYNRNDIEDNPKHAGVIAQEVEKVLPEVVSEGKDGIKSVAYGNIVSLLIEAIKEQQEQIDKLKEKLENK